MADLKTCKSPEVLTTLGLGSCVGVAIYDPVSKKPWIWDDVTRMRTLNTKQSQKKRQNHICPLQLDIVERLIERYSNKGELVFDPFGGIGTVPYCAINLGRKGLSTELNYDYWKDSLSYLYEAEMEVSAPTLFDLINVG